MACDLAEVMAVVLAETSWVKLCRPAERVRDDPQLGADLLKLCLCGAVDLLSVKKGHDAATNPTDRMTNSCVVYAPFIAIPR